MVDDKGDEVPADGETLGEVLMRGNNGMTGYFEDPVQTQETLAGGCYHSGDLAVRHSDGYIEIRPTRSGASGPRPSSSWPRVRMPPSRTS